MSDKSVDARLQRATARREATELSRKKKGWNQQLREENRKNPANRQTPPANFRSGVPMDQAGTIGTVLNALDHTQNAVGNLTGASSNLQNRASMAEKRGAAQQQNTAQHERSTKVSAYGTYQDSVWP